MRAPIKQLPSQAELLALLDYDPETGALVWRRKTGSDWSTIGFNSRAGGRPAGTVTKGRSKYLAVGIRKNGKAVYYKAHRLIWKMMTGNDPPKFIDHIDGDRLNERWTNLREASNGQNLYNSKLRKDNKTGFKGVTLRVKGKRGALYARYRGQITVNKRLIRVGLFDSPEAAAAAVTAKRLELHGEFARDK